jgi:hypothetical protein
VTALLAVETLLLAVIGLLVVGLLRSHAEILRRLGVDEEGLTPAERDAARIPNAIPGPPADDVGMGPAKSVSGLTLDNVQVKLAIPAAQENVLIAFLTSTCLVCERFWTALRSPAELDLPDNTRLVVATKDTTHESPSRLRELAGSDLTVVMSTQAWTDYEVPSAPYFVYIDGPTRRVVGEGAALEWDQVASLLRDAVADVQIATARRAAPAAPRSAGRVESTRERNARADAALAAAGIEPDDPSLWDLNDFEPATPGDGLPPESEET